MEIIDIVIRVIALMSPLGIFYLRSVEMRLKDMKDKIDNMYDKHETQDMIDLKQEALKEKIDNIKESQEYIKTDIHDIKNTLVKLANKK